MNKKVIALLTALAVTVAMTVPAFADDYYPGGSVQYHAEDPAPDYDVEITSDKTQREFLALCEHQDIHPSQLLMIGNSLKSDIAPALAIGAWAIHIPFHVTWQLEHFEDIDHERLIKIEHFSEILDYI